MLRGASLVIFAASVSAGWTSPAATGWSWTWNSLSNRWSWNYKAWSPAAPSPPSLSDMIAGKHGFSAYTTLWEYGPEAAWKEIVEEGLTFDIPAMGVAIQGRNAAWDFRLSLTGGVMGTLAWVNTYGSYYQDPANSSVLYATMTSYFRHGSQSAMGVAPGTLMQVGKWTCVFGRSGKIVKSEASGV
jgi:hypothetical protein